VPCKKKNGKPFEKVHKLKFVVKNMSHSRNSHKSIDKIKTDTLATEKYEVKGII
jgi:hypothetical protein